MNDRGIDQITFGRPSSRSTAIITTCSFRPDVLKQENPIK